MTQSKHMTNLLQYRRWRGIWSLFIMLHFLAGFLLIGLPYRTRYNPIKSELVSTKLSFSKVITIVAFDRVQYFRRVIRSILAAERSESYSLVIAIDKPSNDSANAGWKLVVDLAESLRVASQHGQMFHSVLVSISNENLGVWKNKKRGVTLGFEIADFVIVLEDDITLEVDALLWFEWHLESGLVFHNKSIGLATCWSNLFPVDEVSIEMHDILTVRRFGLLDKFMTRSWATPWGWAIWRSTWELVHRDWTGQDQNLGHLMQGLKLRETMPLVARCNNIGSHGVHKKGETTGHIQKRSITSGYFKNTQSCIYKPIESFISQVQENTGTFEYLSTVFPGGIFTRERVALQNVSRDWKVAEDLVQSVIASC